MASPMERKLTMFNKQGEIDAKEYRCIQTIKIDEKLPPIERWFSYLRQVKNPYCVRVGDMAIKLNFPDEH